MQSIENATLTPGQKVFVRCDLDVPIINGVIQEEYRLKSALQTLNLIINKGAKPLIAGHIGKPDGKFVSELSTKQLIPYFSGKLASNNFEMLENLRFDPREEANDPGYAKELAVQADVYVNESFATSHRAHASIVGVPKLLRHFAGVHLMQEIDKLGSLLNNPQKPFVAIVGGAKLESKKPVISKLLQVADQVLIGGKLATSWTETVPSNLIVAEDYVGDQQDIGLKTVEKFRSIIAGAATILWAGPLGVYEEEQFMSGTRGIAEAISEATLKGAVSVIGGGDTITAAEKCGVLHDFSFVSVGGGAMLQFLVEGTLPGLDALN